MGLFYVITIVTVAVIVFMLCYETFREHKAVGVSISVVFTILCVAMGLYDIYIPMTVSMLVCGLYFVSLVILKSLHLSEKLKYLPVILAFVLSAVYFGYGIYVGQDLKVTHYEVDMGKELRIAQISDTHMGLFFDTEDLREAVDLINMSSPDIVVITGDLIDEKTDFETFQETCKVLSELKSTYGTFYITGNHDGRRIETSKLLSELKSNNVTPLLDDAVKIGDDFVLVGRRDEHYNVDLPRRLSVKKILEKRGFLNCDRKIILLDHKPKIKDYMENRNEARVDIMISGHTHGGQIFPANIMFALLDDDPLYGLMKKGDIWFEVSSGASSGMVPFKTATVSEVVIIDLK